MRIAVIGNGMVGQRFLEQLVAHCKDKTGLDITVFCEEPRPAYDRVQLTSFFSGKSAQDLNVVPEQFFQEYGITLRLNDSVQSVDPVNKLVRSARYKDVPYDKLIFATGSTARTASFRRRVMPCSWKNCSGTTFRSLALLPEKKLVSCTRS